MERIIRIKAAAALQVRFVTDWIDLALNDLVIGAVKEK